MIQKGKLIITLCVLLLSSAGFAQDKVSYINPIIGTNGMGHTFPGACVPFGLVQLSPDTDTIPHNVDGKYQPRAYEYCAGYQHKDSSIVGFSHTHFSGTGHSDLGDILIMPTTGALKLTLENGKTFEVKAGKVSDKNRYVKSVSLNGKPYTKGYITQQDIMNGGVLSFEMTSTPNRKRLFNGADRPYSLSDN